VNWLYPSPRPPRRAGVVPDGCRLGGYAGTITPVMTSLRSAKQWVAKLDSYSPAHRDSFRERCIRDAQAEVIELIVEMIREAKGDEFNNNRDATALGDLEEQVLQLLPPRADGPPW
jgi:hypothetical protein